MPLAILPASVDASNTLLTAADMLPAGSAPRGACRMFRGSTTSATATATEMVRHHREVAPKLAGQGLLLPPKDRTWPPGLIGR